MRVYCYTCQTDTLVGLTGRCGFCDAHIVTPRTPPKIKLGGHAYIGTEEFYEATYQRYLELRSVRKVAAEVWEAAGYSSLKSCANTLHEVWATRGWPTYSRGYSGTKHGKSMRGKLDRAHRRALRIARGETRGVRCAGVKLQRPGKGRPCRMFALAGSTYCRYHDPAMRHVLMDEITRMRERQEARQ